MDQLIAFFDAGVMAVVRVLLTMLIFVVIVGYAAAAAVTWVINTLEALEEQDCRKDQ